MNDSGGGEPAQLISHPLKLASLQLHDMNVSPRWLQLASQFFTNLTSLELDSCYEVPMAMHEAPRARDEITLTIMTPLRFGKLLKKNHCA